MRARWLTILAGSVCLIVAGCRPAPPAPVETPAPQPPPKPHLEFVWLTDAETKAAEAFVATPDLAQPKQAFLSAYKSAVSMLKAAKPSEIVPVLLRLWEFNRVARAGHLSSVDVRTAVGLAAAKTPPTYHPKAALAQPDERWRLATPDNLDAEVRKILRGTKMGAGSYAEFVKRWARYVVVVQDAALLDPASPMRCEGSADPLSGAIFLCETDRIRNQRRPPWKLAAGLVHESEYIRWYYEQGQDARLLYPLPARRNAYLAMHQFGQALLTTGAAADDRQALIEEMDHWRSIIRAGNRLLGYPEDDLTVRTDVNVPEATLEQDPLSASVTGEATKQR